MATAIVPGSVHYMYLMVTIYAPYKKRLEKGVNHLSELMPDRIRYKSIEL